MILLWPRHGKSMAHGKGTVRTGQEHDKGIIHPDQPFAGLWLMEIWPCLNTCVFPRTWDTWSPDLMMVRVGAFEEWPKYHR
jgi:hypothetical protein